MNSSAPSLVDQAEERVLGWQTRLHRWAVQDEQARFGDLFNLICDPATLLAVACFSSSRINDSRLAEPSPASSSKIVLIEICAPMLLHGHPSRRLS